MNWPHASPRRKPGMNWSGLPHLLLPMCHPRMSMLSKYRGVMELGLTMPPSQFCISNPSREFICFARGLFFEGSVLAYDPITNGAEWIPVCGTAGDPSWMEEMLALVLYNMLPRILDEGAERLARFGEHSDENERDGAKEASSTEAPCKEAVEEETMDEGHR